eukprot:TRINITY_DN519_c0_g1_i1.p1 TRINITY_DN519_c0_g1~~TRINITY_DN519_c0_g1_i1.p1  ORF type:complete len:151 (+),score=57.01 TRINITY_DN519_c0_g1_i1:95-547(+)
MIRRPPRSTQSRSSAASDVYKRQHLGQLLHGTGVTGASGSLEPVCGLFHGLFVILAGAFTGFEHQCRAIDSIHVASATCINEFLQCLCVLAFRVKCLAFVIAGVCQATKHECRCHCRAKSCLAKHLVFSSIPYSALILSLIHISEPTRPY